MFSFDETAKLCFSFLPKQHFFFFFFIFLKEAYLKYCADFDNSAFFRQ